MNEIEELFIPYTEALEMKELGFNEPCMARFSLGLEQHNTTQLQFVLDYSLDKGTNIPIENNFFPTSCYNKGMYIPTAPTFSQAFRWFRKNHKINAQIAFCEYEIKSENSWKFTFDNPTGRQNWQGRFNSYEKSELECLRKLISIVKK